MSAVAPTFFIVGAAKAGTTAMHNYLGKHPQIFMSQPKELNYFCRDLNLRPRWEGGWPAYLRHFAGGSGRAVRGESSPSYLLSSSAAALLAQRCPQAKVLVLLRNPVEAIQAVHAEARRFGIEPIADFVSALRASDRGRRRLEARPGGTWLRYREIVTYGPQLERYRQALPPEQLLVLLFDDLIADPAASCRQVLRFLGVDPTFTTTHERMNERWNIRSHRLQRLLLAPPERLAPFVASPRAAPLVNRLLHANRHATAAARPSERVLAELADDFRTGIDTLGDVLGRDLSSWWRRYAGSEPGRLTDPEEG